MLLINDYLQLINAVINGFRAQISCYISILDHILVINNAVLGVFEFVYDWVFGCFTLGAVVKSLGVVSFIAVILFFTLGAVVTFSGVVRFLGPK